jgi:aldehyde dehydrogenase (NAD+)
VTLEAGKIESEALGEVQEMIDICDFAVGLAAALRLTIASERPGHRLMEQWHPLGPTPSSPRSTSRSPSGRWNAALALVCGNRSSGSPAKLTPLTAIATHATADASGRRHDGRARDLNQLCSATAPSAPLVADRGRAAASAPPADAPWAARSRRSWPRASVAASSSSAATTRPSS